jgi:hypothetical protein
MLQFILIIQTNTISRNNNLLLLESMRIYVNVYTSDTYSWSTAQLANYILGLSVAHIYTLEWFTIARYCISVIVQNKYLLRLPLFEDK